MRVQHITKYRAKHKWHIAIGCLNGSYLGVKANGYIIYLAMRFNLPKDLLRKMIFNVGLESVVGTVPFIGDLFDAYYKSNIRNLEILDQHLNQVQPELERVEFKGFQKVG